MLYSPACPSMSSLGYEICYYAVENTHVNAADFDYEDTALAYPFGGAIYRRCCSDSIVFPY